jgi:hypothetical protein
MKHKTCRLIPNTLAQTLVVLEGCCMMFSEYVCNSQVAVAKIFSTTTSFNHTKQASNPTKSSPISSRMIIMVY